jgi:MerR family copper efflux transcriptional regulator
LQPGQVSPNVQPHPTRDDVHELTHRKLEEVENQMEELDTLRRELTLLVNLCRGSKAGCPIIDDLDSHTSRKKPKRR